MIFILDETDGAQRSNELILVNANGLGLRLCHCYRAHIPGSEKPYFWEGSVEMVLGLYQGPPRIPVFLVLASKEFTAGSGRAGSPHRKDFVDTQFLEDSELLCEGGNTYIWPCSQHHTGYSSNADRVSRTHITVSICPGIIRKTCRWCVWEVSLIHPFSSDRAYLCMKVKQAANTALKNGGRSSAISRSPRNLWEARDNMR